MKAITIYQQLKDLNPKLFTGAIDSIKTFSSIPKSLFSPTYNTGQRTDGYHTLDNSIHEADGFYEVIQPNYDSNIYKLGTIYFDTDHFTYNLVELTQSEKEIKTKEDLKNSIQGVFAFATTPDGTKDYAIVIGNDGKISTVLI